MVAQFMQGIYKKNKTVLFVVINDIISLRTHFLKKYYLVTLGCCKFLQNKKQMIASFDEYIIIPLNYF